jgi:membrane protein
MGAALAYYTLLSLMPLLLMAISVAGLVLGRRGAEAGIVRQIQAVLGTESAQIVEALLTGAKNRGTGIAATIFGAVVLMFGASGVLVELRDALNTIWEVPAESESTEQELAGIVRQRLWGMTLVIGIVLLLTASLVAGTFISAAASVARFPPVSAALLHLCNTLFSLLVVTVVFGAVYRIVPQASITWRDVILGAGVTSVLFAIGNLLLGIYLGKTSFTSTYGAASSAVVLAIWVYYSSLIFFFGAEFTRAFARFYGSAADEHPDQTAAAPDVGAKIV